MHARAFLNIASCKYQQAISYSIVQFSVVHNLIATLLTVNDMICMSEQFFNIGWNSICRMGSYLDSRNNYRHSGYCQNSEWYSIGAAIVSIH